MVNFSKMPCIYWSTRMKMSYLQRRIIVYSIMYYYMNESCVTDQYFDSIAQQLVQMKKQNPKEYKQTSYYYAMCDFDGSTGFDLYGRLIPFDKQYLTSIATAVLDSYRKKAKKVCQ